VSGGMFGLGDTCRRITTSPMMHQPAYQMKAPYSLNALYRGGQEMATTKFKNQFMAVTIPIPGGEGDVSCVNIFAEATWVGTHQCRGCKAACSRRHTPAIHVSHVLSELEHESSESLTNGTGPSPGLYAMPNRYMLAIVSPIRRLLVWLESVTPKAMEIKAWQTAMNGKVAKSRLRRPNVSIVQNAGNAKTKLMTPKPRDASKAGVGWDPARRRIIVL
jgi:hypothetical protein